MNPTFENIHFYRAPEKNIGFIRNDKCGSTFFSNIFKANGWIRESSEDIDWDQDHVFSFIMDPYVRHVKGMVEDAVLMGSEKLMLQNFGLRFWQNISWIGSHSMPMSVKFGDCINQIDWIPIDIGLDSTEDIVDQLLKPYNIKVEWSIEVDRNESSPYEKEMFEKFSQLLNSDQKHKLLSQVCLDYEIYKKSIEKYKNH